MNRVGGKVALVTGAASEKGLGFATARALVREGANVVLTDIAEDAVTARAASLQDAGADKVLYHQCRRPDGADTSRTISPR